MVKNGSGITGQIFGLDSLPGIHGDFSFRMIRFVNDQQQCGRVKQVSGVLSRGKAAWSTRAGSSTLLAYHFGEDPAGFLPQKIIHVTCRFQAQGFSGDGFGFIQGDGPDDLLNLRNIVRRHAQLAEAHA